LKIPLGFEAVLNGTLQMDACIQPGFDLSQGRDNQIGAKLKQFPRIRATQDRHDPSCSMFMRRK
jgi:hypothetical protein